MSDKPYNEPTSIDAIDGEVTLDGPDGVGLSMTPEAAKITSERLKEGAERAEKQSPGTNTGKREQS
jgi:hypothetical protein